uniref:Uncharacterized protein n=1 Tax=Oryza rufipogon TaxID=4529 RepID=A0A0E0QPM1_ORYRU
MVEVAVRTVAVVNVAESNREGRDVTQGLPDPGTTRDERTQQCCQYRAARQETTMNHTLMSEETSREGLRDEWRQWQLGDAAAMLEVDEEDPERPTMTSADDEVVDARTAMKTTKAAKLRSERTTQLQLHVDVAARSPLVM